MITKKYAGNELSYLKKVLNEEKGPNGTWVTAPVTEGTSNKIELSILTRARQFRSEALQ